MSQVWRSDKRASPIPQYNMVENPVVGWAFLFCVATFENWVDFLSTAALQPITQSSPRTTFPSHGTKPLVSSSWVPCMQTAALKPTKTLLMIPDPLRTTTTPMTTNWDTDDIAITPEGSDYTDDNHYTATTLMTATTQMTATTPMTATTVTTPMTAVTPTTRRQPPHWWAARHCSTPQPILDESLDHLHVRQHNATGNPDVWGTQDCWTIDVNEYTRTETRELFDSAFFSTAFTLSNCVFFGFWRGKLVSVPFTQRLYSRFTDTCNCHTRRVSETIFLLFHLWKSVSERAW